MAAGVEDRPSITVRELLKLLGWERGAPLSVRFRCDPSDDGAGTIEGIEPVYREDYQSKKKGSG